MQEERVRAHASGACPAAWAQIVVENNEVKRFAMPLTGRDRKLQLRGSGRTAGREVPSLCRVSV